MASSNPAPVRRQQPVRTCVGCRERATKNDLVRVLVGPDQRLVPDPSGKAPGRGAHVHPRIACLDLAVRRKALSRALRVQAALDDSAVRCHLARVESSTTPDRTDGASREPSPDQKRSTRS